MVISSQEPTSWDPNTLLAALSQASAVLVAIIGGFLVSRLVAISSEREGIRRLLAGAAARLSHVESDLKDAHQIRLGRAQHYFFEQAVDKFLDNPSLDVDALLHEAVPRGTTEEELRPYAVELRRRTGQALVNISAKVNRNDTKSLKLHDLVARGLVIEDADQDLYKHAFKHRRGTLPTPSAYSLFGGPGLDDPLDLGAGLKPGWAYEVELRRTDEEIRVESDLRAQCRAAAAEKDRLNAELVRVGRPAGVASAIWMLGILSLGILLPVVMMAFEPTELEIWPKTWLIGSFVIGLVWILGYVGWFWKRIGSSDSQASAKFLMRSSKSVEL